MKSKSRVEGLEWAGRLVLRFMGGPFLGVSRVGIERGLIKSSLLIVCLWRFHGSYDLTLFLMNSRP